MSVPSYQEFLKPLLEYSKDKEEHTIKESVYALKQIMSISDEDFQIRLKSGELVFYNRLCWAKSYLTKALLLNSTGRGKFQITIRGLEFNNNNQSAITSKDLLVFDEFKQFMRPNSNNNDDINEPKDASSETPEELLQDSYNTIRNNLKSELLDAIMNNSPSFFEQLVIDLMLALGYGGSDFDAATLVGKTGDEGIDGIIKEDTLGLDVIYLQAKRHENSIGRPEIQKFVGALHGKRAKKGVFITTSSFCQTAYEYVNTIEPKVSLIDGKKLTDLMIDYNLGVSRHSSYEIKKIDSDYFDNNI